METFTSSNGLKMVEGELYNWTVEPVYHDKPEPFGYCIHVGSLAEMFQCLYMPDEEILSICSIAYSSDEVFRFYCATLWDAEVIVHAYIKANEFDIKGLIYDKETTKP